MTVRELNRRRIDTLRQFGQGREMSITSRQAPSGLNAVDAGRRTTPSETLDVVVQVVLTPIHQATVKSKDGRQFSITRKTPGLKVDALVEGQRIRCTVAADAPKVLHAQLL